ncbi:hypothetical protein AK830_g10399 [Neonectria ditissima]|uniref:Uncharacterized protein n=1 Tax=Neonectria ditissima TaxID=78410 RepID=A0A0P7B742_9HYPO|nr:hypothetical protein AK830_g10399 [Neonectria ditissima]
MERHSNLFQALSEFYTVLVQLAILPTNLLKFPDPVNGIESFDANAAAALEAGFSPEAVELMARLPYLDIESREESEDWYHPRGDIEIMPSTFPITFTTTDEPTASHYEGLREMDDDLNDEEYLIPGTCIRLSRQNIYGITWIYDTETRLLREWKSFDSQPDVKRL